MGRGGGDSQDRQEGSFFTKAGGEPVLEGSEGLRGQGDWRGGGSGARQVAGQPEVKART